MIQVQPAVKKETLRIASGTVILSVLMIAVFLILGFFDMTVLWGALLGSAMTILNFFLLGLSVQRATEKMKNVQFPSFAEADAELEDGEEEPPVPESPEMTQAKRGMQLAYTGRMMLVVLTGILALSISCFNPVAALVPFLFPRIIIFIYGIFHKEEA